MAEPFPTAGVRLPLSRRVSRHLSLATGSLVAVAVVVAFLPGPWNARISFATAYVALALLAVTLSLGPLNILRGRPNPVSFNLRRDFGIWSAVVGLIHTGFGLTVHFGGRVARYFLAQPDVSHLFGLRADPFGFANHTGLLAALLLLLLAVISNDLSLRRLGTTRWRAIQRWAYALAALTVLHGSLYQLLEKRRLVLVALFAIVALGGLMLQLAGRRRVLEEKRRG